MENEKKKYNQMENVLNKINQKYISLAEYETKRNNKILEQVTDRIVSLMKRKDVLFKNMYEKKFYGGSYYDKIKVGKPEEYDLDLILNLPIAVEPAVYSSDKAGFVKIRLNQFDSLKLKKLSHKFPKLNTFVDHHNYLSTTKVLQWIERIIHLSLNEFKREKDKYCIDVKLDDNQILQIYVTICKAGCAFTLKLRNGTVNLDIDLVPCFQFREDNWPNEGYKKNPFPQTRNNFLVVPKKPHNVNDCFEIERYWRLSFQEQERDLITGQKLKTTKPAIKLLKKLRDKQNHVKIASYYIKTVFLWKLEEEDPELWTQSLSYVFMKMLKFYAEMIQDRNIPYYWNESYNLIGHLKQSTLTNISNTLKNIINDVDSNLDDPFVIAKYLINQDDLDTLRNEVRLGSKNIKKQKLSQSEPETAEEKVRRMILNKEFIHEAREYVEKYMYRK